MILLFSTTKDLAFYFLLFESANYNPVTRKSTKNNFNLSLEIQSTSGSQGNFFAPMMAGGTGNQRRHLGASGQSKKSDLLHQKSIKIFL